MKISVSVVEILERVIFVDAPNEQTAIDIVNDLYRDEQIVLSANDFCETNVIASRIEDNEEEDFSELAFKCYTIAKDAQKDNKEVLSNDLWTSGTTDVEAFVICRAIFGDTSDFFYNHHTYDELCDGLKAIVNKISEQIENICVGGI